MKYCKKYFLSVLLCLTAACFLFSCGGSSDCAVRIDGEAISMDEFNSYYYIQNKLTFGLNSNEEVDRLAEDPSELNPQVKQYIVKENFLEHLIAQKLLYKKAMADQKTDQKEMKAAMELSKMNTAAQYYLASKLKDMVQVTDQEVEQFYSENKKALKGVPLNDETINKIKQNIYMQKSSAMANQYIMDLITEAKIEKEGFKTAVKAAEEFVQTPAESAPSAPEK